MTQLRFPGSFDAVVCVFGVFFVPDTESLVTSLWNFVKPGGKLAITTWGKNLFEPLYSAFDHAVKPLRPDLVSNFRPWDRLVEIESVKKLLSVTGSKQITVTAEAGNQKIEGVDSW